MTLKLRNVLLIDDDCMTNYINQIILEESGMFDKVEIAETAVEALDKIESQTDLNRPEIIFLDINMPGLNGWDFVTEYNLYLSRSNKKAAIIMLTSSNSPDDKIKAVYAKGVTGYINKPLTADKVIDAVGKYLH